ncbi:hypothetical protein Tco_0969734 [Tanacetum coccineum]
MMILSKTSLTLGRIIFRVDVPMTQSQLILSTQGTYRITSAPRTPNPEVIKEEFSAQRKPMVIRFRLPPRRQDPKTSIPTSAKIDITNFDETIQMSIATQCSIEDYKA